ncbi:hypothetical protein OROMI_003593 [Orobanche minor]
MASIRNESLECNIPRSAKIEANIQRNKAGSPRSEKIESDWKRKRSADQADLHHHHHRPHKLKQSRSNEKTKLSSSEKVRAFHILIKHQDSRSKSSWKDPEGRLISVTTREEAVSQLEALRDLILTGDASFQDLASLHSHCKSAKRGGDLGSFGRGQMQKPFEEASFALKVGEISDIVDTNSGVHIIMRTG